MGVNINSETADELIRGVTLKIRQNVESGISPLSSESTFRFLFAWELGRANEFSPDYRFDFEWNAYSSLDSEDTFLDLLVYTDPTFKVALEFKLPKSSDFHMTNSTQTRAKICRDISRLNYLVRKQLNSIRLGYFLCATNEGAYLTEGRKTSNIQYKTYNGTAYQPNEMIPKGRPPNGIQRDLLFPNHIVRFEWEGTESTRNRLQMKGRFAWLTPIRISG
ncbi:MAG: hypothetical protein ABSA50_02095 [Candidatus Bathyarchaeia archaeon]